MDKLRYVHRPCDQCPWRRDTPPGQFPAHRYQALRATSGQPGREAGLNAPMFACHKTPDGKERACAGWLVVAGLDHLGVRLAIAQQRLAVADVTPADDWPALYDTYEQMAQAMAADEQAMP